MKKKEVESLSIVIPLYNSEETLTKELLQIESILSKRDHTFEIVVVDDKSTDRSSEMLKIFIKRKNFRVYLNKRNLGIAKNLKRAYGLAKMDYIVLYSVDGDWEYSDINKLIKKTEESNADIVIGERSSKNGYTIYRKIVSYSHNKIPFLLFGTDTIDAASIKIFKRSVYRSINLRSESVFREAEFIIKSKRRGYVIKKTKVSYFKKSKKKKNFIPLALLYDSFKDAIRLRLHPDA